VHNINTAVNSFFVESLTNEPALKVIGDPSVPIVIDEENVTEIGYRVVLAINGILPISTWGDPSY
jgi:hypothetical protein